MKNTNDRETLIVPFEIFWTDRSDAESIQRITSLGQSEWRLVAPLFSDWLRRLGCPESSRQWDEQGLSFQIQSSLLSQWEKDGYPQIAWPSDQVCDLKVVGFDPSFEDVDEFCNAHRASTP